MSRTGSTESSPTSARPSTEPSPTRAGPVLLLPNMRSLPAEDVEIRETTGGRELRFAAVLANFGVGPLELVPDERTECPDGQRHASQVLYRDGNSDGGFTAEVDTGSEVRPAGCMVHHEDHEHWHFDASARYVLTRPGSREPVVATDKVSFCMRDSRRLPGQRWAQAPETYGDCERDKIQGITAGWGDVYDADLAGQALELPDGASGTYCLRLTADPFDLLQETDEDDNSAAVALEINGADVARVETNEACLAG